MIMLTEHDQRRTLKKEKSNYEKGMDMNNENCKPKTIIRINIKSSLIWCDENLLAYS